MSGVLCTMAIHMMKQKEKSYIPPVQTNHVSASIYTKIYLSNIKIKRIILVYSKLLCSQGIGRISVSDKLKCFGSFTIFLKAIRIAKIQGPTPRLSETL